MDREDCIITGFCLVCEPYVKSEVQATSAGREQTVKCFDLRLTG